MTESLLAAFPQLDDTAAAAIAYAFQKWWLDFPACDAVTMDDALLGFAAGWLARPADYTG